MGHEHNEYKSNLENYENFFEKSRFTQKEIEDIYNKSLYFRFHADELNFNHATLFDKKNRALEAILIVLESVFDIVKKMKENDCNVLATTETAATPYGFAVKKVFQKAFNKKIKVVPVNVKIRYILENIYLTSLRKKQDKSSEEKDKVLEKYKILRNNLFIKLGKIYETKLKKLGIDKNEKIFFYDETTSPALKYIKNVESFNENNVNFDDLDKIYNGSALSTAVTILKLAGFKNLILRPVKRGCYFLGDTFFDEFENKRIAWRENVTRVLYTPEIKTLFRSMLQQEPKDLLKYYFKIEKNFPTRLPFNRERAQKIIYDMKLIGELVSEKIKEE